MRRRIVKRKRITGTLRQQQTRKIRAKKKAFTDSYWAAEAAATRGQYRRVR